MKTDISRLTREQQEGANREFERLPGALRSFPPLVPKKPTKDSITTDKRAALHRALDHVLDSRKGRARDGGVLTDDILFDVDQRAKTGSGKRTPASIAAALKYAAKKYDAEVMAALRRYYGVGAKDAGGKPSYPTTGIDYKGYEIKKFAPENFVIKKAGTVIGYEPTREDAKRLVDHVLDSREGRAKDFDLGATWDAANINRRRAWLEEVVARVSENSAQGVWNQLSKPWASVSKPVKARLEQYAAAKILR